MTCKLIMNGGTSYHSSSSPDVHANRQLVTTSFQLVPHQKECLISSSGINMEGASVGLGDIVGDCVTGASVVGGPSVGDCHNGNIEIIATESCNTTTHTQWQKI